MFRPKIRMRQAVPVLFVAALLALSLLLIACGSRIGNAASSYTPPGTSQQTTRTTQTTPHSGNTTQQVQDAIQAIDNAANDVNSADATAAAENNANEEP